jgi:hypothetical protein
MGLTGTVDEDIKRSSSMFGSGRIDGVFIEATKREDGSIDCFRENAHVVYNNYSV